MSVAVVRGANASDLLEDPRFLESWRALYAVCPFRSVFVSPTFVRAWIDAVDPTEVLVAAARDADGVLDGLLIVARVDGVWTGVGGRYALVHGWLGRPLLGSYFIERALIEVARHLVDETLTFTALPDRAPDDWTNRPRRVGRWARVDRVDGFVRTLDPASKKKPFEKRANSTQLAALQAIGPPSYRADIDGATFRRGAEWIDAHHAANAIGARYDRTRVDTIEALLDTKIVVSSALMVGDRLASVFVGYVEGDRVALELLAEDPELEPLAPAYLHWLMLEPALLDAGYHTLDVTSAPKWLTWLGEARARSRVVLLFGPRARWRRDARHRFVRLSRWALRRVEGG